MFNVWGGEATFGYNNVRTNSLPFLKKSFKLCSENKIVPMLISIEVLLNYCITHMGHRETIVKNFE